MLYFSFGAVGFNFLVAVFVLEWALIVRGYMFDFNTETQKFPIDVERIIVADFVAAAILISFGAVIGKINPTQLIIMAFIEVLLQSVNEFIGIRRLCAFDVGESMFVHAFGKFSKQNIFLSEVFINFILLFNRCLFWSYCSLCSL